MKYVLKLQISRTTLSASGQFLLVFVAFIRWSHWCSPHAARFSSENLKIFIVIIVSLDNFTFEDIIKPSHSCGLCAVRVDVYFDTEGFFIVQKCPLTVLQKETLCTSMRMRECVANMVSLGIFNMLTELLWWEQMSVIPVMVLSKFTQK